MNTVVLVHGWGYDAHLWDAVRPLLDPALPVVTLDFGYFGAVLPAPTFDEPVLAVGHSLGTLWWLAQSAIPWRRLLSINGFPRFVATADFAPAVAPRVLSRMKRQFQREPMAVLAEFHARCGGHAPSGSPNLERLAAGLDALGEWDGRAQLAARRSDVVALAGTRDPIVSAEMSTMAFGTVEFIETTGHLLPVTHPEICARWIERLARA
ncbi:MAG: alpha/beta fold hydrolase [Pseudomonadota bacterium]